MPPELDLFAVDRGSVTAPAGCGKTQLIADSLELHLDEKPILILTHTNAGVAALRSRLNRVRVSHARYRISTIDGFAMRVVATFPQRSGHDPRIFDLSAPARDYPAIRRAASRLLRAGHISDVIRASYARLIVDEYQDCSLLQHEVVEGLAAVLPTYLLGDPMQAIFGFAGPLVDWRTHVEVGFPAIGALATPWRWRRAGTEEFGRWLLEARRSLAAGQGLDLRQAPAHVTWIDVSGGDADQRRRTAAQTRPVPPEDAVLIVGDARNPRGRHQITSQTPGATVVEAVDMGDLVNFAREFTLGAPAALSQLTKFVATLLTRVEVATFLPRVETVRQGRARTPPTQAEHSAVAFAQQASYATALDLLEKLEHQPQARVFRPDMLQCLRAALQAANAGTATFLEAAIHARERHRHRGRPLPKRAVGSTLLLKGLEADVAVILHPELMDVTNLYVAITRASRRLIVCAPTPVLRPLP